MKTLTMLSTVFALLLIAGSTHAQDVYAAIWERDTGRPYYFDYNMIANQLANQHDALANQGFEIVDISGYSIRGQARFAGIWEQSDGTPYYFYYGMSENMLIAQNEFLTRQGYSIANIDAFSIAGMPYFNAIWKQNVQYPYRFFHGLTSPGLAKVNEQLVNQGYQIVDLCGYDLAGEPRYAAIWQEQSGAPAYFYFEINGTQLEMYNRSLTTQGYQPVLITGYNIGNQVYYAAVWQQMPISDYRYYYGITGNVLQNINNSLVSRGYRIISISGYHGSLPLNFP